MRPVACISRMAASTRPKEPRIPPPCHLPGSHAVQAKENKSKRGPATAFGTMLADACFASLHHQRAAAQGDELRGRQDVDRDNRAQDRTRVVSLSEQGFFLGSALWMGFDPMRCDPIRSDPIR
eukprot:CAMPEP_0201119050 /NCGR_PEP_ID=MMETSP0850-20130426/3237_1 /ASSEMBLY_ACC=CAM_ASM_000622 /TAXON_ID=183588 /ORGANISM="Pseudo-nitzschia fraudulenta, Strain WWA7" /LENGTH=122 /DNA_ID=CAMNT_0047384615 /DNA_START=853 /DNA_END=1221 /DNA_ORIENTATION=-